MERENFWQLESILYFANSDRCEEESTRAYNQYTCLKSGSRGEGGGGRVENAIARTIFARALAYCSIRKVLVKDAGRINNSP